MCVRAGVSLVHDHRFGDHAVEYIKGIVFRNILLYDRNGGSASQNVRVSGGGQSEFGFILRDRWIVIRIALTPLVTFLGRHGFSLAKQKPG